MELELDFVAQSFVRRAEDIHELKGLLGDCQTRLIAKIKTESAVKNTDRILDAVDAIMVARGDFGVDYRSPRYPLYKRAFF